MPKCNFCKNPAIYDGKTKFGPWAYMCEHHFKEKGIRLGIGFGQKLAVKLSLSDRDKLSKECSTLLVTILDHPNAIISSVETGYGYIGTDKMSDEQLIAHHKTLVNNLESLNTKEGLK